MEDSEKDSGEDFEKKLFFWNHYKKATAFWTFK